MRRPSSIVCGFLFAYAVVLGQAPTNTTFEVASVRPSPPPGPNERVFFGPPRGGPGTRDPGQIRWERAALRNIIMTAYDMQTYQVAAPDWLATERYDIVAKVPEGATKEQLNLMWQHLLKERFGLAVKHESKEFQVDELTVAKGGPKLKLTDLGSSPDPFNPLDGPPKVDKDGLREMNGWGSIATIFPGNGGATVRLQAKGLTLSDVASRLAAPLGHPVIDKTGLGGRYDFTVEYEMSLLPLPGAPPPPAPNSLNPADAATEPGSSVVSAVEKQLGLKLTRGKAMLDVIVVDHVEKIPTAN